MTETEKINFTFTCFMYKQKLKELGITPEEVPHNEIIFVGSRSLGHVYTMLEKMIVFAEEGKDGKAYRWLGFVQGVLWSDGIYSIDDMREHNTSEEEYNKINKACNKKEENT